MLVYCLQSDNIPLGNVEIIICWETLGNLEIIILRYWALLYIMEGNKEIGHSGEKTCEKKHRQLKEDFNDVRIMGRFKTIKELPVD